MKINLSDNIRYNRKARGVTQEQLAAVMDVSVGAVYKWESGQSVPELNKLVELANYFDMSVDSLIGYEIKDNRLNSTVELLKTYRLNKNFEGLAEAERALNKYPNAFAVVYNGALLYWLFGMEKSDKTMLRRALELFDRAELLLSQNDDQKINEVTIARTKAGIMQSLGNSEKAVEILKRNNVGGIYNTDIGLLLANDCNRPDEALEFLSESVLEISAAITNIVIGYINVYFSKKDYDLAFEIAKWGISVLSGLIDKNKPCYLDKVNASIRVCMAFAQFSMTNCDINAVCETLRLAKADAERFDSAPNFSPAVLRFVKLNRASVVYDDFGTSGMQSADKTVESVKDGEFAKIWKSVKSNA